MFGCYVPNIYLALEECDRRALPEIPTALDELVPHPGPVLGPAKDGLNQVKAVEVEEDRQIEVSGKRKQKKGGGKKLKKPAQSENDLGREGETTLPPSKKPRMNSERMQSTPAEKGTRSSPVPSARVQPDTSSWDPNIDLALQNVMSSPHPSILPENLLPLPHTRDIVSTGGSDGKKSARQDGDGVPVKGGSVAEKLEDRHVPAEDVISEQDIDGKIPSSEEDILLHAPF